MSLENFEFAFPRPRSTSEPEQSGMTLRDYFAAQALNGILACATISLIQIEPSATAESAYKFADAMLSERSKP